MKGSKTKASKGKAPAKKATSEGKVEVHDQYIVEIVSDSGEGAQTAGQMFGTICAKTGNGVWTVEIIPAEIEPPARSTAGASGNRIRFGTESVTNMGDEADVVVAFNEQVLYSRIDVGALKEGTHILLEEKWATDIDEEICQAYATAVADFKERGYIIHEIPMEEECLKHVADPRRGKNIWVVGLLCAVFDRDVEIPKYEIVKKFKRKGQSIIDYNFKLLQSGYEWALKNLDLRINVPVKKSDVPKIVCNGNYAAALGVMGAGIEVLSMYPITPATSVSHYLAPMLYKAGGFLHQAEDEIAAAGFALGCSYAGKTPVTVTSGPGMALKTEFVGTAVMAELPLVIIIVQRGGPSTGLPTRVEQGDAMTSIFGAPGDAPKIVMAAATIEECFHLVVAARKLAELYRGPVVLLTDANLGTGQCDFPRPDPQEDWLSPPVDQSDWDRNIRPYEWDEKTGFSPRPIPGQRNGHYVLTGLAHNERSKIAYESAINQHAMAARSRKIAAIRDTLKPPEIVGAKKGDLLVVGWGSTRGAIEEAVGRIRGDGGKISSINLTFLSPLQPGLKDIFKNFKKVMTVEINYGDEPDNYKGKHGGRRYTQLATLLRAETLVDVDFWARVPGVPLPPGMIEKALRKRMGMA